MKVDADGRLVVADSYMGILRVDVITGHVETLLGSKSTLPYSTLLYSTLLYSALLVQHILGLHHIVEDQLEAGVDIFTPLQWLPRLLQMRGILM